LPITELKWDARTVTDIPGNTVHWFFAFFWLTEGSRNKNYLNMVAHVSALEIYTVKLSIRPLIGVNNVKPDPDEYSG
jgi:hypothetical protein